MKIFDPHIHMTSRSTDDYEAMARAGILAIVEPAFWLGQPRTHVGSFVDYFNSLLGWERFRASQFGIRHFCTIGLNPKEANNPKLSNEVLALLPRFLAKDGVVAVGEIGFDDQTDEEEACLLRQIELARRVQAADPDSHAASRQEARHDPHHRRGAARRLSRRARADRSQQRGDAADRARDEVLGRPHDLSEHQDGRAADGRAREEVRHRSHHRQQRRRLGHQRSAEGAEDDRGDARAGHRRTTRSRRSCGTTRSRSSRRAAGSTSPISNSGRRSIARRSSRPIPCCAATSASHDHGDTMRRRPPSSTSSA